ncbi:hypothetical protein ACFU98_43205 [Streptomyces sp. NPDC057575]|uniref:hypothetical protein n=1 Tax=unclassified Streptomyces TaxID=2593676 RepID=UPI0036B7D3A0
MDTKAACGPERDPEFFAALDEVFAKYPEAASRYAMSCLKLERDVLKIDFERQVGVARVEDGRIITEFHDRDSDLVRSHHSMCCEWVGEGPNRKCVWICPE